MALVRTRFIGHVVLDLRCNSPAAACQLLAAGALPGCSCLLLAKCMPPVIFPAIPTTASQPLRGDEIATSRGIFMPHFAVVLTLS